MSESGKEMGMLERAARASILWSGYPEAGPAAMRQAREHASVVIGAALDLSNDPRTFQRLAAALAVADDGHPEGLKYREQAKAALAALLLSTGGTGNG